MTVTVLVALAMAGALAAECNDAYGPSLSWCMDWEGTPTLTEFKGLTLSGLQGVMGGGFVPGCVCTKVTSPPEPVDRALTGDKIVISNGNSRFSDTPDGSVF